MTGRDRDVIIPLLLVLVWLHLECCAQVLSPQFQKEADGLERVQKRTMKVIKGLENLHSKERLKESGLFSLEQRRLGGHIITVFQ